MLLTLLLVTASLAGSLPGTVATGHTLPFCYGPSRLEGNSMVRDSFIHTCRQTSPFISVESSGILATTSIEVLGGPRGYAERRHVPAASTVVVLILANAFNY